jgi:hypothetical protein
LERHGRVIPDIVAVLHLAFRAIVKYFWSEHACLAIRELGALEKLEARLNLPEFLLECVVGVLHSIAERATHRQR